MKCDAEWHSAEAGTVTITAAVLQGYLLPNQVRVLVPRMSVATPLQPLLIPQLTSFYICLPYYTDYAQNLNPVLKIPVHGNTVFCKLFPNSKSVCAPSVRLNMGSPSGPDSSCARVHVYIPFATLLIALTIPGTNPSLPQEQVHGRDISGKCGDVEIGPPRSVHLPEDLFRQEMSPHFYASFGGGRGSLAC
jgi:hypothetical protein